ncbi:MAG: ABC transporter permease, partial [Candidatus Dormiibacterota bacterium]
LLQAALRGNTVTVTVLAFVSALVIGAVMIVVATPSSLGAWATFFSNPLGALSASVGAVGGAYGSLLSGAIGSPAAFGQALSSGQLSDWSSALAPLSETLVSTTPLLFAGLGVAFAFRGGMFNIGGQGQVVLGAVFATWAGYSAPWLPGILHVPLALACGALGGALWGFVPGILKARTGAHEVITSMMLNYVALNLLTFLLTAAFFQAPPRTIAISREVAGTARLWLLPGLTLRVNLGIVLAVLAALAVAWMLQRSRLGFEIRMYGLNAEAARAAGVAIAKVSVLGMTISGLLVGLGGATEVLGIDYQVSPNYGGQIGFTAITVAILGRGSPLGVGLAALLYGAFTAGGRAMQVNTGIPSQLIDVLEALIVLFVAAPGVIRTVYRIRLARGSERVFSGWA